MIRIGTATTTEHPVIVDLRTALGEALDARQVLIVRAYLAMHPCWCGALPTHRVPVDLCITEPTGVMRDGEPALNVCEAHVDRDGYEVIQ